VECAIFGNTLTQYFLQEDKMKNISLGFVSLLLLSWAFVASAQTPEAPSAPSAPPATTPSLTVSEAVIATSVESLTPQGVSDSFDPSVGKLYAFTKITGAEGETSVKHLWFQGDHLVAEVELLVKAASWRTYSSKIITPDMAGQWKVDVTAQDGTVLKSMSFTIKQTTP
jgi:hypothetical protein